MAVLSDGFVSQISRKSSSLRLALIHIYIEGCPNWPGWVRLVIFRVTADCADIADT